MTVFQTTDEKVKNEDKQARTPIWASPRHFFHREVDEGREVGYGQIYGIKSLAFIHQVDLRVIFDQLKMDLRAAMDNRQDTASSYHSKNIYI